MFAIVQHFWAIVPAGFQHVGPLFHDIAKNGMPTLLGFIGF